jgi:hypothetical protein
MSIYTINLDKAAELGAFNYIVDLDGTDFRLDFQFNSREGFWYFNLLDIDGNIIRSSLKVVSNFPLLRLFVDRTRPLGELISIDTRYYPSDPGLEDLNVTSVFGYADEESVEEASD